MTTLEVSLSVTFGLSDPRDNSDLSRVIPPNTRIPRAGYSYFTEEINAQVNPCLMPVTPQSILTDLEQVEQQAIQTVAEDPTAVDVISTLFCTGATIGSVVGAVGTVLSGGLSAPVTAPLTLKLATGAAIYCGVNDLAFGYIPKIAGWLFAESETMPRAQAKTHGSLFETGQVIPVIPCDDLGIPNTEFIPLGCGDNGGNVPIPITYQGIYPGEFVPHLIFQFYEVDGPPQQATAFAIPYPDQTDPNLFLFAPIPEYRSGDWYRKRKLRDRTSYTIHAETREEAERIGAIMDKIVDQTLLPEANEPTIGQVGKRPGSKKSYTPKTVYLRYVTAYLGGVDGACDGWDWRIRYDMDGLGQQLFGRGKKTQPT